MDFASFLTGLVIGGAAAGIAAAYHWRQSGLLRATLEAERATATLLDTRLNEKLAQLTQEALQNSNQQFLDLATAKLGETSQRQKTDLTELLTPLKANLDQLAQHNQSIEKNRAAAYEGLTQQILSLKESTSSLSNALRPAQTRGRWGEIQLQRLIELSGMAPHTDYDMQQSFRTSEGNQLRPDCIINLPGGKQVVIDVKTPLEAYRDVESASSESAQAEALARFAGTVRAHVKNLSAKAYWQQLEQTPDYVILFLPAEHYMSAALRAAPDLFEEALKNQVILASTSTLMILLKAYAYSWRQEKMVESAQKVAQIGRELYTRLGTMTDHFGKLGRSISGAMKSFNDAMGSYESRVLTQARRFQDFGILEKRSETLAIEPIEETQPRRLASLSDDASDDASDNANDDTNTDSEDGASIVPLKLTDTTQNKN